jgi:hypothetical protein
MEESLLLDAVRRERLRSPWLGIVEVRLRGRGRARRSHDLVQEAVVAGLLGRGLVLENVSRLGEIADLALSASCRPWRNIGLVYLAVGHRY